MKTTTITRYLLVIAAVGLPGFLKFDRTGLTHDFGLINPQSISRILIFIAIAYLFACLGLYGYARRSRTSTVSINLGAIFMLSYYGMFLILSAVVLPLNDFMVAGYRIAEWALIIFLCWYHFSTYRENDSQFSNIGEEMISVLRLITSLPLLFVLGGLVLFPDLAYVASEETGAFRLGGYIVGPNSLGVVCGIGAVLFWTSPRRKADRFWSIALFLGMVLTYSRGAMVGFALYVLYHSIFILRTSNQKIAASLLLLVFIFGSFAIDKDYFSNQFLRLFSRGASLETITSLNSRTQVWSAALEATSSSPAVGSGFIQGPKNRLEMYFNQDWWRPPHAHNDILNAGVAGGFFMAGLTALIYVGTIFLTLRLKVPVELKVITATILIQCGARSVLTPVFSSALNTLGALMLILIIFLSMHHVFKRQVIY